MSEHGTRLYVHRQRGQRACSGSGSGSSDSSGSGSSSGSSGNEGHVAWIGVRDAAPARELLSACMSYAPTPLRRLPELERELALGRVFVKDEGARMGQGSFKALGGAYAVLWYARREAERRLGRALEPAELLSPAVREALGDLTVACASAGNHGLSMAAGARALGLRSVVWLSESVPRDFERRLSALGSRTVREGADYEASMVHARIAAERRGWALVSDASSEGYTEVPRAVMQGYAILLEEAAYDLDALGERPSHVFVQAGVGGLAAPTASYFFERWGDTAATVVVEPEAAACLLESVRKGAPVRVSGGTTTLGRLDCREPSLLAFETLSQLAHAFMTITDASAGEAAEMLAREGAVLSPCGAAGAAGLIAICRDGEARSRLGLDERSRVLLFGTEAPIA